MDKIIKCTITIQIKRHKASLLVRVLKKMSCYILMKTVRGLEIHFNRAIVTTDEILFSFNEITIVDDVKKIMTNYIELKYVYKIKPTQMLLLIK